MSRKSYSKEFKESAVRLMLMEGMSAPAVSQKLGVSEALLYKWKQLQVSKLKPSDSVLDPQALVSENEQLRKQLARAEKINEILKKTVAYFAEHEE
ncbi:MAG: transposase [Abditibacteriaceae bacterium]